MCRRVSSWNSMKCKIVIKLCFSLGKAWMMSRLSKETCWKDLGLHLELAWSFAKFRASQSSFLCKTALSLEEIQRNHSFGKGIAQRPYFCEETSMTSFRQGWQLMLIENLLRAKYCTEDLMFVNSFNFDSLPPLYRGGSELRNPILFVIYRDWWRNGFFAVFVCNSILYEVWYISIPLVKFPFKPSDCFMSVNSRSVPLMVR